MLSLRDVVVIEVPPDVVFDWFLNLESNYRSWHPAHVACSYVHGRTLEDGAVLYAEEHLFGRLNRLKFTLKEVEVGRAYTYRIFPGARGGFFIRQTDLGTEFTAEINLGWSTPILGVLIDAVVGRLLFKQIEEVRRHMKEEGVNLKALLEPGVDAIANSLK